MKKLTTTFLISLMLLTFSNSVFAGFFGDIFKELFGDGFKKPTLTKFGRVYEIRCKVEYTQLDLSTGLETIIKHSDQYRVLDIAKGTDALNLLTQDLTDKINIWLNESPNNVITNLTILNCKEKEPYFHVFYILNSEGSGYRWSEYKGCADEFNIKLIDLLERPKQWGYNVHKERLIEDYEEGCKNYIGEGNLE
jgi:hypothetical protein